jgi:hypothetical protein
MPNPLVGAVAMLGLPHHLTSSAVARVRSSRML